MEDTYVGLLNTARQLKQSRGGGGDDGQQPSGSTTTAVKHSCASCGDSESAGYLAACCNSFLCDDCLRQFNAGGTYTHLFQVGGKGQAVCPYCNADITDLTPLKTWVPANALPATALPATAPTGNHVGSDADAWNFTLYHGCGQVFKVVGWEECDVLADDCPKCGSKSVNLTGTTKGHSYELRDLLGQLAGYHQRASASTFAQLATTYPDAWRALRLTSLVDAILAGRRPDLSYWNQEAVAFLIAKAAEIKKRLG